MYRLFAQIGNRIEISKFKGIEYKLFPNIFNSKSGEVLHVFARLPFEDCKLDPAIFHPVITEVEFQREVNSDGLLQVIPLSSSSNYNSNKGDWEFLCITSNMDVLYIRSKVL